VQRRVGEHRTQPGQPRGDARQGRVTVGPLAKQHDRPVARAQELLFRVTESNQSLKGVQVCGHHGERLFLAVLAGTQPRDRVGIAGVAEQVEATQALDGQDLAVAKPSHRLGDRVGRAHRVPV